MRTREIPREARRLRTYKEIESYLVDFAERRYPFLWIVGRPGIAKTESIKAAVRGRKVFYQKGGQLTPAQLYKEGYMHRGEPIILDDAEHILDNPLGAKLVSALGDTTPVKQVFYGTTSRSLHGVPGAYSTTSQLCIIANKATRHEDVQSRAITLHFDPTSLEIHRAVARWFWDQEIHDWFGRHLYRLGPIDTRWYVVADRDKRAGRDWSRIALEAHALHGPAAVVQDLEGDGTCPTREGKAERFVELMGNQKGASRASYFRLLHRLKDANRLAVQAVPPIPLRRTKPQGTPSIPELSWLEAEVPGEPEEEPRPIDVPAREAFAQPIRGHTPRTDAPRRPVLDDSLPWEQPVRDEEDDEEPDAR
jgi:hypothetical protein